MEEIDRSASPWKRGLGDEHDEATEYMRETKEEMNLIMEYVDEVHNNGVRAGADSMEAMYADTKRLVAVKAGEDIFDQIDIDKDGTLSCQEVSMWLKKHPELHERMRSVKTEHFEKDWTGMLDMLDADRSQSISRIEFSDFWTKMGLGSAHEAGRLFQEMDGSGDGNLQTHEVKSFLKKNAGLRQTLAEKRASSLEKEWASFFDMVNQGTNGAMDKAQFATLWAASGLGLNVVEATRERRRSRAPPTAWDTDEKDKGPPSAEDILARGAIMNTGRRPHSAGTGREVRLPNIHNHRGLYATDRNHCYLERPVTARKVDYAGMLTAQTANLNEREAAMTDYRDMLKKVELYQVRTVQLLETTFEVLGKPKTDKEGEMQVEDVQAEEDKEISVFQGIGGEAAIGALVDRFYDNAVADPRINFFFEKVDMRKLRRMMKQFMNHALGGKVAYTGRRLEIAHRRLVRDMGLSGSHFDAWTDCLRKTFTASKVRTDIAERALEITEGFRDSVLGLSSILTINQRIGGESVIAAVVDRLLIMCEGDQTLSPLFRTAGPENQRRSLISVLSRLWRGGTLTDAVITPLQGCSPEVFGRFLSQLKGALIDFNATEELASHAVAMAEEAREQLTPPANEDEDTPQRPHQPQPPSDQKGTSAPRPGGSAEGAPQYCPHPPTSPPTGGSRVRESESFDGEWIGKDIAAEIRGATLIWRGGGESELVRTAERIVLQLEGQTYAGMLTTSGRHLQWSDGDVWAKVV
eukprot:Hpha_TRINITY_DN13175_c0_g1::TRINITY_DN13175_c0_g1_i1::g.113895::m.113895